MPYVVTSECIQCGACFAGCESGAIMEGDTQSHIDPEICIECGLCKQNCPSDAIIFEEEMEQAEPSSTSEPTQESSV
jgi:ferredoxin